MAYPAYIREKARSLRRDKQLTIDELADRLALSRSTIYYWVRDLPIPSSGAGGPWPADAQRKGTLAMQRKYRLIREEGYEAGVRQFDELAQDPSFRDFICMYIGEGYKRRRNRVSIGNSDPAVILLAHRWIRALGTNPVRFYAQYHADQDLTELRSFWGSLLGVDPDRILFQRQSNTRGLAGRTWRSRHGVLTVDCADTYLRSRLQAWIDRVREEWGSASTLEPRGV